MNSTDIFGWKVFYDQPEAFEHVLRHGETYEIHIMHEMNRLIPGARGFLDIGTNAGIYVALAKRLRGADFPVTAVDVNPANICCLLQTAKENKWTNVFPLALGASDYSVWLKGNDSWNAGVSKTDVYGGVRYLGIALDDIPIWPANVIKIDVEGSELHALHGMWKILKDWKPAVIFEFCPRMLALNQSDPEHLIKFFLERGFRLTVLNYKPGMRAEFSDAKSLIEHVASFTEICDIMAEPI